LKAFVESIVELEENAARARDTRKDLVKELKKVKGAKPSDLLAVQKASEMDADKLRGLKLASAILGKPIYASLTDVSLILVDKDDQALAQEKISVIVSIDEEIEECKAQIKEIYTEVKDAGYLPALVKKVVEFKLDPTKQTAFEENSLLLDRYLAAVA
jgi:uncharacterized protein (UPF0335 family)